MSKIKLLEDWGIPTQEARLYLDFTDGDTEQAILLYFDQMEANVSKDEDLAKSLASGSQQLGSDLYLDGKFGPSSFPLGIGDMDIDEHKSQSNLDDIKRDYSEAVWQWEERGVWTPYDKVATGILESSRGKSTKVPLDRGAYFGMKPGTYVVDMERMKQVNSYTGFQRNVRRIPGKKKKPKKKTEQKLFKDTDEQFLQDERDRIKDEAKTRKLTSCFYNIQIPLAKSKLPKLGVIRDTLNFCYQELDHEIESKPRKLTECQICFEDKTTAIDGCGCMVSCIKCLGIYLESRVKSKEVLPWLPCPGDTCTHPVPVTTIMKTLEPQLIAEFAIEYLSKMLARSQAWVPCSSCPGGFFFPGDPSKTAACKKKCPCCGKRQTVSKNVETDKGLEEMLKSGVLRRCPQKGCRFPQMKDVGLCNIMHCGKCKSWWNWRTREVGQSMGELKRKARRQGSLWEPGELAYQRRLEQTDPAAFKRLLERNGMKYDPNYIRGHT